MMTTPARVTTATAEILLRARSDKADAFAAVRRTKMNSLLILKFPDLARLIKRRRVHVYGGNLQLSL
ncbi:hypothetical protein GN244_ATG06256 [Phytophthora infestans]|uniref:Uncharacterized protein n=1 Tax=Phytophthora infestans TaxID=4787 RepID=A0A833T2Y3_PHYIN|nr:hypothetical protein GN244_ATG15136 [Phytophthora infestans]KAF4041499.1 hypothetical protein GN244_ATG06256 [Phytophthora infestans]KAF4140075.1 hypothetical protein GN958_ATG10737 [Phytophthora infestans]